MRFDRTALADTWQFHLRDDAVVVAFPEPWSPAAMADRIIVGENAVAVRSTKNWFVPVTIEVLDQEPEIEHQAWDHIVLTELALPSGKTHVSFDTARTRVYADGWLVGADGGPAT